MIQSYTSPRLQQNIAPPHQAFSSQSHVSIERVEAPILDFQSDDYFIRYVVSGEEMIRQGYLRHHVGEGSFLLVNPNQSLQIRPASSQGAQSVNIRIPVALMRKSNPNPIQSSEDLPVVLFDQVYEAEEYPLADVIQQMVRRLQLGEVISAEQLAYYQAEIADKLWEFHAMVEAQIAQITSAKLSTRQELYRRLSKAKIHIHTHLHTPLDLDTLSQVACLSKFHFIRLFKEAFGLTPRQYLIGRRLDTASRLLVQSSRSFHEICQEVGLKDSSSFGRLFKRNFGTTPHMYRQLHAVS